MKRKTIIDQFDLLKEVKERFGLNQQEVLDLA
jgi:hypothetical protein